MNYIAWLKERYASTVAMDGNGYKHPDGSECEAKTKEACPYYREDRKEMEKTDDLGQSEYFGGTRFKAGKVAHGIEKYLNDRGFTTTCNYTPSRHGKGHFYLRVHTAEKMADAASKAVYDTLRKELGITYIHTQPFKRNGGRECVIPMSFTI